MRWFQSGVGSLATGPFCGQHSYVVRGQREQGGWRVLGPDRLVVGITRVWWGNAWQTGSSFVNRRVGLSRVTQRRWSDGCAAWTVYRSMRTYPWS